MEIHIETGDITTYRVDAIVNAANNSLLGGGGVDGAIHHAAGPELLVECRKLHGCETGEAKITRGYLLPAKSIIHTVGSVWKGGENGEARLLTSCYQRCMDLALNHNIHSIAFPAISCGVYGYPIKQASSIAINTLAKYLVNDKINVIYCICFNTEIFDAYQSALDRYTA
jgi:O-acetyl-ADP-ribose deacetylase (regulator of RNase III)